MYNVTDQTTLVPYSFILTVVVAGIHVQQCKLFAMDAKGEFQYQEMHVLRQMIFHFVMPNLEHRFLCRKDKLRIKLMV